MYSLNRLQGLDREKSRILRMVFSCRKMHRIFPPVLICGVGGCGKSLLAQSISEELGYHFFEVEAATLLNRDIIVSRLREAQSESEALKKPLLFFIDECHRLPISRQEALYYPLERHCITTANGTVSFPPFCLVAATTQPHLLDQGSFVTRMERGLKITIGLYPQHDIIRILASLFQKMGLFYSLDILKQLSSRCLGVPRIARNLSEKVRDQIIFRGGSLEIQSSDLDIVFELEDLDSIGLQTMHRRVLELLRDSSCPLGLKVLSAHLNVSTSYVEEVIEPILLSLGFIVHTSRGRTLSETGIRHISHPIRQ